MLFRTGHACLRKTLLVYSCAECFDRISGTVVGSGHVGTGSCGINDFSSIDTVDGSVDGSEILQTHHLWRKICCNQSKKITCD